MGRRRKKASSSSSSESDDSGSSTDSSDLSSGSESSSDESGSNSSEEYDSNSSSCEEGDSDSSSSYHTFSDSSHDEHQGDMRALEKRICKELQETNYILVRLLLKEIGNYDTCKMMLKQTHRLEKGNGIRTADNKRRKSPGGVYFHLGCNRIGQKRWNKLNKQCSNIKKEKL